MAEAGFLEGLGDSYMVLHALRGFASSNVVHTIDIVIQPINSPLVGTLIIYHDNS